MGSASGEMSAVDTAYLHAVRRRTPRLDREFPDLSFRGVDHHVSARVLMSMSRPREVGRRNEIL